MRAGILGASGLWHATALGAALRGRGHDVISIPATRLRSVVGENGQLRVLGPGDEALHELDLLLVRGLPRGSLEQVIFRVDTLHVLAGAGVRCVNGPSTIERTVDKSWASATLAAAGLPTPPTVVCEYAADALAAFDALGGDVVVKPLFGAMGSGIARVHDRDVAHRVFRGLELERAVYYVQRTVMTPSPPARRDLRVLVVAGEVAGAMERATDGWRANIARGARPRAVTLDSPQRALALAAAAAVQADVCGVDMLVDGDGSTVVIEVNGIPGWQALQSVCDTDLTVRVVQACESLVDARPHVAGAGK